MSPLAAQGLEGLQPSTGGTAGWADLEAAPLEVRGRTVDGRGKGSNFHKKRLLFRNINAVVDSSLLDWAFFVAFWARVEL